MPENQLNAPVPEDQLNVPMLDYLRKWPCGCQKVRYVHPVTRDEVIAPLLLNVSCTKEHQLPDNPPQDY